MSRQIQKHSYGILLHRTNPSSGKVEIFLGKANGPRYWGSRRDNCWGLPKGRPEVNENELQTALREYCEEVGSPAPNINYTKFLDFQTPHGKIITVFIGDATGVRGVEYAGSVKLQTEYPLGSQRIVSYREVSDAQWFTVSKAKKVMLWGQQGILEEFIKKVKK